MSEEYLNETYEEEKNRYEQLKPINGKDLFESGACLEELARFTERYGRLKDISDFDEFINFAKKQQGWIDFLLTKGFIKLQEKTYHYGDIFKIIFPMEEEVTYGMLAQVKPKMYCIISLETGNRITDATAILNHPITEEDLKNLAARMKIEPIDIDLKSLIKYYLGASK